MNNAINLYAQNFGNTEILLVFSLLIFSVLISKILKLDLEKDFVIASLRTCIQLIAVGYILRWVLKSDSFGVNLLILLVMTLVAAQAVTSRLKQKNLKYYVASFVALFASVWPLGFLSLEFFFHSEALKQSLFFIPFMGVLMGNSLSAISLAFLGLERVRKENILEVETFKALGASGYEACQRLYRELLRSALTPIINGMTIVGIVSLPGVMAGQLIGGVDPVTAARFQILVMFLILLTALVGSLIAIFTVHKYFMPAWLNSHAENVVFPSVSGRKLILSGPSGTGKSRLLKSMLGLDEIEQRQRIQVPQDLNFVATKTDSPAQYLHQKAYFTPGTVAENLQYPFHFKSHQKQKYSQEKAAALLQELGFSQDVLNKNAMTLSGGEGQLVHLVRSLLLEPQVLFLDEPSSSLDAGKTALLEQFLNRWVQEGSRNLVMITHNQEQARRFGTKTVLLQEGRLAYE